MATAVTPELTSRSGATSKLQISLTITQLIVLYSVTKFKLVPSKLTSKQIVFVPFFFLSSPAVYVFFFRGLSSDSLRHFQLHAIAIKGNSELDFCDVVPPFVKAFHQTFVCEF